MKKLFYHWTGCVCKEQFITSADAWDGFQPIYGWCGNLTVIGHYNVNEIKQKLLGGLEKIEILNVCPNCFGAGYDVYFLKEG